MKIERIKELKEKLYKCKSEQEIHNLVTNTIAKCGDVVTDDNGAEKYFNDLYDFREVKHVTIINQTIDVCETIDDKEVWVGIQVIVSEHYTDSGSNDYVYSYTIDYI